MKRSGTSNTTSNTSNTSNTSKISNYNNITRLLNPYRYNTRSSPNNNVNVYSFALDPEKFQPTGAINMDMYNSLRIQLILDKNKFQTL